MKRYMISLGKRLLRLVPLTLLAALVIFAGLAALFTAALDADGAKQQKFTLALCGSTEDPMVQLGISALESVDDTRFSVELRTMTEADARQALRRRELDAYISIPAGFVESALHGNVPSLDYVTLADAAGTAALFQQEVTQVISEILLSAQKGVYGIAGALTAQGLDPYLPMNDLCLNYVALALQREQSYDLQVLGMGSGLGLGDYLACGFTVLLCLLLCLSFAPMLVQRDVSLNRMLAAKGLKGQGLCEYAALLLGLGLLTGAVFMTGVSLPFSWRQLLPVVVLASAFSFFVFSLVSDLLSAALLHFLSSVGLCLLSGCLYPLPFLPGSIQQLSRFLPTNACREYLAAVINGTAPAALPFVLGCSAVFLAAGLGLRHHRIRRASL